MAGLRAQGILSVVSELTNGALLNPLHSKGHGVSFPAQATEAMNWPTIQQSTQAEKKRRLTIAPGILVVPDTFSSSYISQPLKEGLRGSMNKL